MAIRKTPKLQSQPPSIKGSFIIDSYRGTARARPYHTRHPVKPGSNRAWSMEVFRLMCWLVKQWEATFYTAAIEATKGTSWFPRDILLCAMYGRMIAGVEINGHIIWSMQARHDVSRALDAL